MVTESVVVKNNGTATIELPGMATISKVLGGIRYFCPWKIVCETSSHFFGGAHRTENALICTPATSSHVVSEKYYNSM